MFWALIVPPRQIMHRVVEQPFHVSMASLDTSLSDDSKVQLMVRYNETSFLLCTLSRNSAWQVPLNLNFEKGAVISFLTNGNGIVHLSGYLLPKNTEIHEEELEYLQKMKQNSKHIDQRIKRKTRASSPNHNKTKHVRLYQNDDSRSSVLSELSETECPMPSSTNEDDEYYEEDMKSQYDEEQGDKKQNDEKERTKRIGQKSKKKENLDQHKRKVKDSKEDQLDEEKKKQLKQKVQLSKKDQLDEEKKKQLKEKAKNSIEDQLEEKRKKLIRAKKAKEPVPFGKVEPRRYILYRDMLTTPTDLVAGTIHSPMGIWKNGTFKYYNAKGKEITKSQFEKLREPDRYNPHL